MTIENERTDIETSPEQKHETLKELNARLEHETISLVAQKEAAHTLKESPKFRDYPLEKRKEEIENGIRQLLRSRTGWEDLDIQFAPVPSHIDSHLSIRIIKKGQTRHDTEGLNEFRTKIAPMLVTQLPMLLSFPTEMRQVGIFLNVKLDEATLNTDTLNAIARDEAHYGDSDHLKAEKVVVDYSSPNIAKTMHVGHLRSTIIGASLIRLLESQGAITYGVNHLGDWGTQFGQLVSAHKRWATEVAETINPEENPVGFLAELYKRVKQAIKTEEGQTEQPLTEEGRTNFAALEHGDPEIVALWDEFRRLSLIEFKRIYDRLGIQFDAELGESFYEDKMGAPVEDAIQKGIAAYDEKGGLVVGERDGLPTTLLRKSDGASNYVTRDVAALRARRKLFNATRILYVVGGEQKDHFAQCFDISERLGDTPKGTAEHIAFGMITRDGRKVASREGAGGLAELLDELKNRCKEPLAKKYPEANPESLEQSAEAIGTGALVYRNFMQQRERNMDFDPDSMLDMATQSGPYLQYTHARLGAVLKQLTDSKKMDAEEEIGIVNALPDTLKKLVFGLAKFPEVLSKATDERALHVLCTYLYEICSQFNTYYSQSKSGGRKMIDMTPGEKAVYGKLLRDIQIVLEKGFSILNMKIPQIM